MATIEMMSDSGAAPIWERLGRRTNFTDGCWLWTGARAGGASRYGKILWRGRTDLTHRVSYMVFRGEIPPGMQVHHICETPLCLRPDHLAVVSPRDNVMASDTLARRQALRTHCPKGHPYDEKNTYMNRGLRHCRLCMNERGRLWRAKVNYAAIRAERRRQQ